MLSRTSAAFCLFVVGIAIIIPGRAQRNPLGNVTLFEGARLIAGDGSAAIESAAFVVENYRDNRNQVNEMHQAVAGIIAELTETERKTRIFADAILADIARWDRLCFRCLCGACIRQRPRVEMALPLSNPRQC